MGSSAAGMAFTAFVLVDFVMIARVGSRLSWKVQDAFEIGRARKPEEVEKG